ncbi:PP2C family protein-serine/threonine phosphatase [Croceibacterium soli]|uniref:PP2C family protein-serine/threonine phosphatase n=1 Tax=Croceibacterium soli TaxID=1739690 RepID=UPI002E25DCBC|nr:SpoIIE family protein phosphatase [Croceibacterium soli]
MLIVDDDEILGEFIALELQSRGCSILLAPSGEEALKLIGEDVDLLLTDWQMPGMDGMELVRRVRQERSGESYLHIAMMTAREGSGAMLEALAAGVDHFLYKPVDSVQLELAVATARRNRLLHRRLNRRNQLLATAHARMRKVFVALREDLDAAASLHERLLPSGRIVGSVQQVHLYQPALSLGGDTIGTLDLGEGKTLFFMIDVRGHGVPAALESFHLHHRLKGFRPSDPAELCRAAVGLNEEMLQRGDGSYATMLAGVIDAPANRGWIVRAGHPPPLLQQGTAVTVLEQGGSMPLGWFPGVSYAAEPFTFGPSARLTVYSDGLTDCFDGRQSGVSGDLYLARLLEAGAERPLAGFVDFIEEGLGLRKASPHDDVSLLALELTRLEDSAP